MVKILMWMAVPVVLKEDFQMMLRILNGVHDDRDKKDADEMNGDRFQNHKTTSAKSETPTSMSI